MVIVRSVLADSQLYGYAICIVDNSILNVLAVYEDLSSRSGLHLRYKYMCLFDVGKC